MSCVLTVYRKIVALYLWFALSLPYCHTDYILIHCVPTNRVWHYYFIHSSFKSGRLKELQIKIHFSCLYFHSCNYFIGILYFFNVACGGSSLRVFLFSWAELTDFI